jgi:hypothetical protein
VDGLHLPIKPPGLGLNASPARRLRNQTLEFFCHAIGLKSSTETRKIEKLIEEAAK